MRKTGYILALMLILAGCNRLEEPDPQTGPLAPEGTKVELKFRVSVPDGGAGTKSMGLEPSIDPNGFYIAVFGGSGFFNEWVKATVDPATVQYDGTESTVYTLSATLSVSDSRLRLHFLANCPENLRSSPPISGSRDTEEYVLSRIRSQFTDTYNDGYWQKVILPNGVKAVLDNEVYVPTEATLAQLPNPIVLVRNFARVYLRNLTPIVGVDVLHNEHQLVTIRKYGLAYAPAEGVIAPILSQPYTSNIRGVPITVAEDDEDTPLYYEDFFINYQRYSISSENPADTLISSEPFAYGGFSPSDQSYDYYPSEGHEDRAIPVLADLKEWDDEHPENNILFVYERTRPSTTHRATRIIIEAERVDQNDVSDGIRYYALDIVNTDGVSIPLLRNQTYTVHLLDIEAGSGEETITKAAKGASAAVSGDPDYQDLINVSDGKSSIGASFTEKFYVQPQTDSVMFRYIPTNIGDENYAANVEGNDLVSIQVGVVNAETGVFTALTPSEAESQGVLAFKTDANGYRVQIVKDNGGNVVSYVRDNNAWVVASASQIADMSVEKWGMIRYELSESYLDDEDYFSQERTQAIHVRGSYNSREIFRNVVIRTSPRQEMRVMCQQKYLLAAPGQQENVRILIPTGLSRSVFPLEFILEADSYSLTPYGDDLPVDYGTSIVPDNLSPSFYYVRSLTQAEYDRLGTRQAEGILWKTFECHFKTTLSDNAGTVYVYSPFFDCTNAHDEYYNYAQRIFDHLSFTPATVYHNGNVTFSFQMDSERSGSPVVWWDPGYTDGLSANKRVLPPVMTVTLSGLNLQYQEDGVTPVTTALEHYSGNTYLYYTGTGEATSDMANVELALVASGAVGTTATVTLSTVNILENPDLYESASLSRSIEGASFTVHGLNPAALALGMNQTTEFSFSFVEGLVEPVTLGFVNLTPDGNAGDNALLTANGDGTYTLTPTDPDDQTYTIRLKSTHRYAAGSITLGAEDYATVITNVPRATSFTLQAGQIYARGYNGAQPTKLLSSSDVTVSDSRDGTSRGEAFRFNTSTYLNSGAATVNISSFAAADNTTVYFRYTNGGTFYGSCTLDDIFDVIEGTNSRITVNLYRWATGTYEIDFTDSNNFYDTKDRHTFTDSTSGITAAFENCPGERDWFFAYIYHRKDIGADKKPGYIYISNGNKTGCKLTGVGFEYFRTYNKNKVFVNDSDLGAGATSWTTSNSGDGQGENSIVVKMNFDKSDVNAIETLTINYAFWEY